MNHELKEYLFELCSQIKPQRDHSFREYTPDAPEKSVSEGNNFIFDIEENSIIYAPPSRRRASHSEVHVI